MTYKEAVAYLESFLNYEDRPHVQPMEATALDRMRRLCQRLGDPQRSFRSIVVAGTNGKGSICAMLYSMLRESPLRVGLYTSPHVEHLRERMRVWEGVGASAISERAHADDWIAEAEFTLWLERMQPALEAMRRDDAAGAPTYFEVVTALAFLYFRQRRIDVAVLEVGLGGRLDAVNIVEQAVSVIGPIDVDHADVLGGDPAAIACEKAGIIKPGQIAVTAPQRGDVLAVVRDAAGSRGVPLVEVGRDVTAAIERHSAEGLVLSVTTPRASYGALELPLRGRHQADNAAAAVAALEQLSHTGVPETLVRQGLRRVEWPGRLEMVNEAPLVLMDGAHNPHAAEALKAALVELYPGRPMHLLVGMSSDKSVEGLGRCLGALAVSATCTRSAHPRALDPTQLANRLFPFCPDVHVMTDPLDAYTYLLNAVAPTDLIVVTGSLYVVGELRAALRQSHVKSRPAPQLEPASSASV